MAHILPTDLPSNYFEDAVKVEGTEDPSVWKGDLKRDWVIGLVPHGGVLGSLLAHAASVYMQTHHADLKQTDLITSHIEFLARCTVGPCKILITPLKLGRQFSNLRIQLLQIPPSSPSEKVCCEALLLQGSLALEASNTHLISLPTQPLLNPSEIPDRDTCVLSIVPPELKYSRPAAWKIDVFFAPGSDEYGSSPATGPSVRTQWVRWSAASSRAKKFTVESLPYLVDAFRPLPDSYGLKGMWYPTVSFGIDVRRGGEWEWLGLSIHMYEVQRGRFGVDIVVFEEGGLVVATSRHVVLIVGGERNLKGRTGGDENKGKEKTLKEVVLGRE